MQAPYLSRHFARGLGVHQGVPLLHVNTSIATPSGKFAGPIYQVAK